MQAYVPIVRADFLAGRKEVVLTLIYVLYIYGSQAEADTVIEKAELSCGHGIGE